MRIIPLAEVLQMDIGEKVPSLKGKILKVYDQTHGTNEHGAWSIQNLELVDPNDVKVKLRVKLFGQKPIEKSWQGRILYIESAQGEKGIKHVTMTQDTYKWKEGQPIKKQLEVKEEAVVGLADNAVPAADAPPAPPVTPAASTAAPAPTSAPAATAAPAAAPTATTATATRPTTKTPEQLAKEFAQHKENVTEARQKIGRAINAFELIMQGVDHLNERRKMENRAMTPEQFQGITTSIFISMDRAGMVDCLPHKELEKYLPPKKEKASQGEGQQQ